MCVNVDSERFTLIDSRNVFTQNDSREMTEARSEEPESNLRNADASTTLSPRQSGLGKDPADPHATCPNGQLHLSRPCTEAHDPVPQHLCTMKSGQQNSTRRNHTMATAPSYVEQQAIPREKNLIEKLMDFSFQRMVTPHMLKMLYGAHLLMGLVAAIWFVFSGFQTSTSNGLLALIVSFAAMLLWIVYCRIIVELLAVVFRAAQVITNSQG
jgi:hypothetical protein